jgi:hypothetical protein
MPNIIIYIYEFASNTQISLSRLVCEMFVLLPTMIYMPLGFFLVMQKVIFALLKKIKKKKKKKLFFKIYFLNI